MTKDQCHDEYDRLHRESQDEERGLPPGVRKVLNFDARDEVREQLARGDLHKRLNHAD